MADLTSVPEVVFVENEDGTYDLHVDRRAVEYDVEHLDLAVALRRRRVERSVPVYVKDVSGYKSLLTARR